MLKAGNYNKTGFIAILLIKILILSLFSSEYSSDLFYEFTQVFVDGNLNPWQYYYENELNLDAFPYHPLMLYILAPFVYFIKFFNIENFLLINFIFKIPLLLADLFILFVFFKSFPLKRKKIILFYFLNPIIIYAIYIHSQLDIIPMAFLFSSVYFLTQQKLRYSAIMIGLSLATKFHILAAFPLILFYLIKVFKLKDVLVYFLIVFVVFLFLDFPFIFSDGFQEMVLFNSKQSLLFDSFLEVGSLKILLPISSILIVYFHFFNQNTVNQDLLFFYFGLLFSSLLFFIYPAPAWYVWIVPFISIFFIKNKNQNKTILLHLSFSISYLIFFIFFYKSEYIDVFYFGNELNFKIEQFNLSNISYSLLLSMLLAIIYTFYKYGVKSNSIYKKQSNLTIGIGGDSAVGKSSLLNKISSILGDDLLIIEGDGEHKWERGNENWNKYTHLDPKANFIHKQAEVIQGLKYNKKIYRSDYDHSSGQFTAPSIVLPKKFIVIAGLHPFYLPKQRKHIDLKIFMNTSDELRKHWKIIRDVKKRGYTADKVIEQIESRYNDGNKFIHPQKEFADLIIEYYSITDFKIGNQDSDIKLGLKIIIDANIQLDEIINSLKIDFTWDYNEDLKSQYLDLREEPAVNFKLLGEKYISNIYEIISPNAKWSKGYFGFLQFVTLIMISNKLKEV